MTGSIDIVCNLFTPEEVAKGHTGLDDAFKAQVRMPPEIRSGVTVPDYLQRMDRAGIERSLLIAVRAGDILLATEAPRGLSARNQLPGTLLSLATEGARVIATVLAGERFTVHLTTGAVETLGLHAGMSVWIVLKTHSCHIVSLS